MADLTKVPQSTIEEAYTGDGWSNDYILEPQKYDDYLGSLLPYSMLGNKEYNESTKTYTRTGNGSNYRKLMQDVIGSEFNDTMLNLHLLSLLSSPDDNYGLQLDNIGNNLSLSRKVGESDDDYRFRLKTIIATRSTFTTVRNMTEVMQNVFEDDAMWIKENPNSEFASVQLNSSTSRVDFLKAIEVLEDITPASVRVVPAGLVGSTWQDVKDNYATWGIAKDNASW